MTATESELVDSAIAIIETIEINLRVTTATMIVDRRDTVKREHILKAQGYLSDALYRLDLARNVDHPSKPTNQPPIGEEK